MKTRKVPIRKCISCQQSSEKRELIRIVRSPEGMIELDERGKKPGRGAYICPEQTCLELAKKNKALERSFKQRIDQQVYDQIERQLLNRR